MQTTIIQIGNSQGIRIPKVILKESGLGKEVEIKATSGEITITPAKKPVSQTALLSQDSLAQDWNRPEEDQAWQNL